LTLATCWLRAGVRPRAERVLSELRAKGARPRIAERETPLFADDADAVEWLVAHAGAPPQAVARQLTNWLYHRGNPARNAPGSGGSPLLSTPRWQQTLANESRSAAAGDAMSKQLVDASDIDLPAESPLAVGDTAVVRTPRWVVGVDLRTGKRIWESPTWENDNFALQQRVLNTFTGGTVTIEPHKLATRTTMASDGRFVFVVEDRGNQPFLFAGVAGRLRRGATSTVITVYNKLLARDLTTEGKLVWEVGGESGEEEPQLAGVYFLGAPLVMGGQLYVIGELKGEITLFVLDAASGKLDWSQPLATVETPVALDGFRRLHGATPSFADGVMVCPTSAGAVVAVDVANRSLLWGYQYPRNQAMNLNLARRTGEVTDPFGTNRWRDGSLIVAAGRVVVTPADSDNLHCINLLDGKEAWKPAPRGDNLFVGGVHGGTVLVVGRRQVQGLELIDGQPSWPAQPLGEEGSGVPSGRGFLSGGHYYLPLSSAEVVKIDLADGTIKARAKSRKGYVLGNLVCNQGSVLSLNEESLDCFFQLDEREQWAAETLRVRPDDPDALAMYGEILIDQGKLGEGLEKLEQSFALAQTERVRELLIESHLELLRKDFAVHREAAEEIEKLLVTPLQKADFAREMALGLQKLGERMPSLEYYLKMCQSGEPSKNLETVAAGELAVRRDRFVRAQIAELRAAATSEERRKMDERIEAHLADLGGPAELAALRHFLSYFGDHDSGRLQAALAERLIEEKATLEAEWWLLRQTRSSDRSQAAAAWHALAELMLSLDRPDDAASCYRRLAREFGDVAATSSQTYKQLVESLPAESLARQYLTPDEQWPSHATVEQPTARSLTFVGVPLEVSYGREPFFEHTSLELETNRQELLLRDGFGRERFGPMSLADGRRIARSVNYSSTPWARANGHILLVQERTQILAIDTLTPGRSGASRVLWRHDLADMFADGSSDPRRPPRVAGRRLQPWLDQRGRPIGGIWPVGGELVCLQRGQKLVGIDVLSGEIVWTRHDIPPAEEIFGDEEHLFVVLPGSNEAIVLRSIDGAKLGTRHVPTTDRFLTYGRNVVFFHALTGKTVVRVHDPWTDEEVWSATFDAGARIEPVGSDEIAMMDRSGKLVIYSLRNAEVVVDTRLQADRALADLQVFRTAELYIVLAGRHVQDSPGSANRYAVQNPGARALPVIDSRAYALDRRTGKLAWKKPVDLPTTATLLNQPAHVPALVFAMNVNDQTQRGSRRVQTSVLCLDVRNGEILCNKSVPNGSTAVVAVADPERKKLEIHCNSATVVLAFGKKAEEEAKKAGPSEEGEPDETRGAAGNDTARQATPPPPAQPDPFDDPFKRE
jgi:outer membrane protein assembly factor BamB